MATSAIQSKYDVDPTEVSSKTVTFTSAPSVGSLIVVVIAQYYGANPSRAISSVADGASAAYTLAKKAGSAGDTQTLDVYYRVATSTNSAITVTLSGGSAVVAVAIVEFPSTYSTYDNTNSSTNLGNGTSPQTATPGSVTQGATSLYVNAIGWNDQYTSASVPTSYNQIVNQGGGGGVVPIFVADFVTSGASNPSSTLTGFTHYWADIIVTFTGGGAATTRGTPFGARGTAFNGGRTFWGIIRRVMTGPRTEYA